MSGRRAPRASLLWLVVVSAGCASASGRGLLVNDPSLDAGDVTTQSESSVARSGNVLVVGYNDSGGFSATGSFTGYAYSQDGGSSFVDAGVLAPVPGGNNIGDPSVVAWNGVFYFATLATDAAGTSFIGVARSTALAPAVTFSAPVLLPGLDPGGFQDKELIAVDTTGSPFDGSVYVVWTEFTTAGGTRILFSRSTDGGLSYTGATQISSASFGVSGAVPSVGPNGVLHVAWEDRANGRIRFRSSSDGGTTWGTEVTAASLTPIRNPGASATCGRNAVNGNIRVNEFPTMAVDMSAGATRGQVYVAYAGDPDGNQSAGDAADVFVVRSTDGGATWSAPASVHGPGAAGADGTLNDNFMPSLAVDGTGAVGVSYYDRRGDSGNLRTQLWQATSTDGGATWSNEAVSDAFDIPRLAPNFDPAVAVCYMGDYNGSAGEAGGIAVTWGGNDRRIVTPGFASGRPDPDVRYIGRFPLP
jgi:hypothetical protein